jgi:hypothetical protein
MRSLFGLVWVSILKKRRLVCRSNIACVGGMSALQIASHPAILAFNPTTSFAMQTATFWIRLMIYCWPL